MQRLMFAVYDIKSQIFGSPFFSVNANTAVRSFAAAANDPNSEISQFPTDFILYELGSFDDTTGVICPHAERLYLCNAVQFQENIKIPMPEVVENV